MTLKRRQTKQEVILTRDDANYKYPWMTMLQNPEHCKPLVLWNKAKKGSIVKNPDGFWESKLPETEGSDDVFLSIEEFILHYGEENLPLSGSKQLVEIEL
jgi:hypothetical protein